MQDLRVTIFTSRLSRQGLVLDWVNRAFGKSLGGNIKERARRLAEEAIEFAQASGVSEIEVRAIARHVFEKPAGDPKQELGGVMVTALAAAEANGINLDCAEVDEINRVLSKPLDFFAARQAAKHAAEARVAEMPETPEQEAARETIADAPWPAGCHKPNSCARNRMCVYAMKPEQCRHLSRNIGDEIDAETDRRERGEMPAPFIVTQDGTRIERSTGRSLRGHVAAFAAAETVYEIDGTGLVLRVLKDNGTATYAPGMRFIPIDIIAELVARDPVRVTVADVNEIRRVEREGLSAVGKALGIEGGQ